MPIDPRILEYLKEKRNRKQYDEGIDPSLLGAIAKSSAQLGTLGGKTSDTSAVENYSNLLSRKRDLESQRQRDMQEGEDKTYLGGINQDIQGERLNKKLEQEKTLKGQELTHKTNKENRDYLLEQRKVAAQEALNAAHGNYYNKKSSDDGKEKENKKSQEEIKAEKALSSMFTSAINLDDELNRIADVKSKQGWVEKGVTNYLPNSWNPWSSGALIENSATQAAAEASQLENLGYGQPTAGRLKQGEHATKPFIYASDETFQKGHKKIREEDAGKLIQSVAEHERKFGKKVDLPPRVREIVEKYHKPVKPAEYGDKESEWKVGKNGKRFRILPPDKDGNPQIEEE